MARREERRREEGEANAESESESESEDWSSYSSRKTCLRRSGRQCKGRGGGRRLASGGDPLTESVKMTERSGKRKRRVFADKRSSEARDVLDKVRR